MVQILNYTTTGTTALSVEQSRQLTSYQVKWFIDSIAQLLTWSSGLVQGVGHGKTPSNVLVNTTAHTQSIKINLNQVLLLLLLCSWVSMGH